MSSAPSALSALVDGLDGYHTAPVRRAACDADFARVCPASSDFIPLPIFLNHCGGELGLTFKGGSNIGCTLPRCAHAACLSVTQSQSMCKNTCVSPSPLCIFVTLNQVPDLSRSLHFLRQRPRRLKHPAFDPPQGRVPHVRRPLPSLYFCNILRRYADARQLLPYPSAKRLVDDLVMTSEHMQPIYHTLRLFPGMPPWSWAAFSDRDVLGACFSASRLPRSGGSNLKPRPLAAPASGVAFALDCADFAHFPMKVQASSWKGCLADEQHPGYAFASVIAHNARRMYPPEAPWLSRVDWESGVADDGFRTFTPRSPLAFLTSLESMDDFLRAFGHLAAEARRIVAAQAMVPRSPNHCICPHRKRLL